MGDLLKRMITLGRDVVMSFHVLHHFIMYISLNAPLVRLHVRESPVHVQSRPVWIVGKNLGKSFKCTVLSLPQQRTVTTALYRLSYKHGVYRALHPTRRVAFCIHGTLALDIEPTIDSPGTGW